MRKCERPEGMRKRCLFISLGKCVGKLIRADLNLTFPRSVLLCWASPRKWWVGSEAGSVEGGSAGRAKVNLKMLELIIRLSQAALSPWGAPPACCGTGLAAGGSEWGSDFPTSLPPQSAVAFAQWFCYLCHHLHEVSLSKFLFFYGDSLDFVDFSATLCAHKWLHTK